MTQALIVGCGYVGCRLAQALAAEGVEVTGTTRSEARFGEVRAAGARPAIADLGRPETLAPLLEAGPQVVFDLVRPLPVGGDAYDVAPTAALAATLAEVPLEAVVYVSSTSVYGRRDGEWTDEATPVAPLSPAGRARVEAEAVYLELFRQRGLPARVCRVPGIYGPGRTLRDRLETGAYRRVDDGNHWVSRIHVDDLVAGLIAAWRRGRAGAVYLLCDDQPVTAGDYAELTAELLGLPLPPAVSRDDIRQELTGSAFERRLSDRRCSNRRMREELGVVPRYPSVHQGVPASLREEGAI